LKTHGQIKCGTIAVADLEIAISDYRDTLGLLLVETGRLSPSLAESWGAPATTDGRYALLQPSSGAACFIRLIEQPDRTDFLPTTTFGWAAYELTVQDAFGWPDRLTGSSFEVIGPPREIAGLPYFVAMQALGPGREMIYLNEVCLDTPSTDLPRANSPADQIFIVILAAPDRQVAVEWYKARLGLDIGETHTIEYTMINKAFGLSSGTQSTLTMIQKGRMPIVEVDAYPSSAGARKSNIGMLPPGNSMVSLAVDEIAGLDLDWIATPKERPGPLYNGHMSGTVFGPAGELLELVET
jgi:catechol 2,3-dioxygenase-like lactoylglutathione lyase family enzyme